MKKRLNDVFEFHVYPKFKRFKKFIRSHKWRIFVLLYLTLHVFLSVAYGPMEVAQLAIVEAAIASWTFVILYSFVDWYRTAMGVQLMSMSFLIVLLTTVTLLPFEGPIMEWVAMLILVSMPIISMNMIRILMKIQRMGWYGDRKERLKKFKNFMRIRSPKHAKK